MSKVIAIVTAFAALMIMSQSVLAAPNNAKKAENNPQVVAYHDDYEVDLHAIPTDPIKYEYGTNIVTTRGNSGQIQAWYTAEDGHGYHSVWNYAKDGECHGNEVLIEDASLVWGLYLTPDADYCVKVNAF